MAKDVVNGHEMWSMAKSQLSPINVKQYDVDDDAYYDGDDDSGNHGVYDNNDSCQHLC